MPRLILIHIMESRSAGLADYAALASAVFTAVATSIALYSVLQTRNLQELSVRPYLNGRLSQAGGQEIRLTVQNVGVGPARSVGFCVVLGGEYLRGYAAPIFGGLFKPGDSKGMETTFSGTSSEQKGVLTCWDANDVYHAFDMVTGVRRSWRPRRWWWRGDPPPREPQDAFRVLYPTVGLDELVKVEGKGTVES